MKKNCLLVLMTFLCVQVAFVKAMQKGSLAFLSKEESLAYCMREFSDIDRQLFVAVRDKHDSKIADLVKRGANANLKAADGDGLLHKALWAYTPMLVMALVEAGADGNMRNGRGNTALEEAESWRASGLCMDGNVFALAIAVSLQDINHLSEAEIVKQKMDLANKYSPDVKQDEGLQKLIRESINRAKKNLPS